MTCPNCGEYIQNTEAIDSEFYNNAYYDYVVGICDKCRKTYRWTEVFTFNRIEEIQEETGE